MNAWIRVPPLSQGCPNTFAKALGQIKSLIYGELFLLSHLSQRKGDTINSMGKIFEEDGE
jgi:hypothetical protein